VVSITKRPRLFIQVSGDILGCPSFNVEGKVIGVSVRRTMKDKGTANVLLPAADVLEIADQAMALKRDAQ
jgi:hypothetical protein